MSPKGTPAMSLQEDTEKVALWSLTTEQRRQVYEEEKNRIEMASPLFSKRTKIIVAVYLLGCLLLYFGVSTAAIEFWSTRTWKLQPEPEFFDSLLEAAVTLIRPPLAVVVTFWAVAIPFGVAFGLLLHGVDATKLLRRLTKRVDDSSVQDTARHR